MARKRGCWLTSRLLVAAVAMAYAQSQDISSCCSKANGTCRSVCEKMSLVEIASNSSMREERIQNIYKFCAPHLREFWMCMNQTIQEALTGHRWWGRVCCSIARSPICQKTCLTSSAESELAGYCRMSDEISFYECVHKQQEGQECCSQTMSPNCNDACKSVLWRVGLGRIQTESKDLVSEACEQSPDLMQCFRHLTSTNTHTDTAKYLPCCRETPNQTCRNSCEEVLRRTGDTQEIADVFAQDCGKANIFHDFYQCFMKKDAPKTVQDLIPRDVAKLHCCYRATTINCRRLCFSTYNTEWQINWQQFYNDCLDNPSEIALSQCFEEVEAPCSLGCSGLTYCSQLNNRPTTLFRSCNAQADLDAHMAVAEQTEKQSGTLNIAGLRLPLKNSTQCPTEIWKNVACALHVKPCTVKGHSSLLCEEDCARLVSACVEWSRAPAALTAAALCARLAPASRTAPCVPLSEYMAPSIEPALLSAREAVTSPCAGAACSAGQVCVVNRDCAIGQPCQRYHCIDGCALGEGSTYTVPRGTWVRVPMGTGASSSGGARRAAHKLCECGPRGLARCQPLPAVTLDDCRLNDQIVPHGLHYFMECNPCTCYAGERVCARRACGAGVTSRALLTGLPCNCPAHHVPAAAPPALLYPNACLAKCAGASDAELEFGAAAACARAGCGRRAVCFPDRNVCLSRLQASCPQHVCVNTSNCSSGGWSRGARAACDTRGRTHAGACQLAAAGAALAYWGPCLTRCSSSGTVCGVNGITYSSECAAWAELVTVDYRGPCLAVGPVSDRMEPKCEFDRILCPGLKKPGCLGFTAPGSCCPKCGGALRILFSKKQIERAVYGTNISASVINLHNVLTALDRQVKIAECALRGYLTIETEIFVSVESLLPNPTDLQLSVCVLEAEKIADLINRESAIISSDLVLSALVYALPVHTTPTNDAAVLYLSWMMILLSYTIIYVLR